MEDSFSTGGGGDGSGGSAGDGERQMKLCSLPRRSPPAVWPWFLTGCGLVAVRGSGVGDPWCTVLEAGRSKIKVPAWSTSGGGPLPGSCTFLLCPYVVEGPTGLSGASCIRH